MASHPAPQLWDPSRGIRFSGAVRAVVVYPTINLSKFYSTVAVGEKEKLEVGSPVEKQPLQVQPAGTQEVKDVVLNTPGSVDATVKPDPPSTSLEYNISEKAFRDAQAAAEGSPESFWSYAMYRGPIVDGAEKRVKVHYCRTKHTSERACQYFLDEKVLGFDLEWAPNANKSEGARRNVSLIQIASPSRISLFHVALFPDGELVAPSFKKIMEDSEVTKVGVAIKADCTRLRNYLGVDSKGLFELSHLYKLIKYSSSGQPHLVNKRLAPLAQLVEEHLRLPLYKGAVVRGSDWAQPLDMGQIIYSASDAYAGLQLYHVMEEDRQAMSPTPPRPFHAELNLPIRLADGVTESSTDEEAEAVEPELEADTAAVTPLPTSIAEAVRESLQVEQDGDPKSAEAVVDAEATPKKQVSRAPGAPKTPGTPISKDSRVIAAESWVAEYCASKKTSVVAPPRAIRAYRIWHENKALDPDGVARLLREPPLKTNTVTGYILEAVRCEKLPFEKPRLRSEVLSLLSKELLEGRYRSVVKAAEDDD
ncbi:related to werner syndrome helicase [Cephalotrichum gorgonifer]|uniref:Related to werner syndrome helicase n=1 Tax=Cephalotrichum gorgonifer TaxID=2041049 RepID=A0AAE8MWY4_9PEZI|nr:related to werner syndrome helicase [Cephalotrichum gorgonifer]